MSISFDGSNDSLYNENAVLTTAPITLVGWFNLGSSYDSDGVNDAVIAITDYDSDNDKFSLEVRQTDYKIRATARAGSDVFSSSETTVSAGTWYHGAAVFSNNSSRVVYLDGSSGTSSTGSSTPNSSNLSHVTIGARRNGASGDMHFKGDIAECAIWNVALTQGEITSLSNGASPLFVRPGSLKGYWPLGGPHVSSSASTLTAYKDIIGGYNMSANGSPTFSQTPPVFNSSAGIFYPNNYTLDGPSTGVVASSSSSSSTETEEDLVADDVLSEVIEANLRRQSGITMHSGGINFKKRDNDLIPEAQRFVNLLNNRFVESDGER